ncbi:HNH endonuclease [Bacillus pinisoli]|uniref:HNH endonuclease n=1 Tax=Bacillus pinisoli TaxID=2901866 RepID=UPI001FF19294|nr:HNH endonuclease signature motif containing protein [Bacillus pinisoli]
MEKNCLNCNKLIKVKPSQFHRKKYCSKQCKGKYQSQNPIAFQHLQNRVIINCSFCYKQINRKQSIISKNNYCNKNCRNNYLNQNSKQINQHLVDKVEVNCQECNVEFKVIKSREGTAKYCSRLCLGKANGRRGKVDYLKRIEVPCTNCGNILAKKPSVVHKWNFCNEKCMGNYYEKSKAFAGEKSGTWQGGDIDYYGPNWRSQRRMARKRDNYTCQDCGVSEKIYGQELSVHHIKPFRSFDGDWRRANQLSNLISLCEYPCHRRRHGKQ